MSAVSHQELGIIHNHSKPNSPSFPAVFSRSHEEFIIPVITRHKRPCLCDFSPFYHLLYKAFLTPLPTVLHPHSHPNYYLSLSYRNTSFREGKGEHLSLSPSSLLKAMLTFTKPNYKHAYGSYSQKDKKTHI